MFGGPPGLSSLTGYWPGPARIWYKEAGLGTLGRHVGWPGLARQLGRANAGRANSGRASSGPGRAGPGGPFGQL
jgi:hypothetical protein